MMGEGEDEEERAYLGRNLGAAREKLAAVNQLNPANERTFIFKQHSSSYWRGLAG